MSNQHYTSTPILLSKKTVIDLIALDTQPLHHAPPETLNTLTQLNTQIVNLIADYCAQHQIPTVIPATLILTPLTPLQEDQPHG